MDIKYTFVESSESKPRLIVTDPEIYDCIVKLQEIQHQALEARDELKALLPQVDINRDMRFTFYSKLLNVLETSILALTLAGQHLIHPEWWALTMNGPPPPKTGQVRMTSEFINLHKLSLVQFAFASTESSLRAILRHIDPQAANNAKAAFKSIYECLLKSKLGLTSKTHFELLDILRLVRNTIHNNGIFLPNNNKDISLEYRGISYDFKQGKHLGFVSWEWICQTLNDLLDLVFEVTRHPTVATVKTTIDAPYLDS